MLIDTHCHLDRFLKAGELPAVLERANAAGVRGMIAIGTDAGDWTLNRDLAVAHPGVVFYSVGLHPCNVTEAWRESLALVEGFWVNTQHSTSNTQHSMSRVPAPVALGEIGLDRFHLSKDAGQAEREFQWQREAFAAGLSLARGLGCPVVIHSREAFAECVRMIDESGVDWTKVVFHCFSEGPEQVAELVKRGGRASFTGILTYKNADSVRAAAKAQGMERVMVETDAPYLAPAPHRGKTNEPAYVRHTAEYAAGMMGMGFEEFAKRTTENAREFFRLDREGFV